MLEFIISGSLWRCHQCAVRMTQGLWFMVYGFKRRTGFGYTGCVGSRFLML
uniref:Uncharacterized protein n=1 Tax=Anguilla anguilla TaxID=7936 RepID=A0A0E9T0K0_ANGAN